MTASINPAATPHLPPFIVGPDGTDTLLLVTAVIVIGAVFATGLLFLWLHSLPERMAHKSQKLQFEVVAVLCLLALFTHNNTFWVIALLLAVIDLPNFTTPLARIAAAAETLVAERSDREPATDTEDATPTSQSETPQEEKQAAADVEEPVIAAAESDKSAHHPDKQTDA